MTWILVKFGRTRKCRKLVDNFAAVFLYSVSRSIQIREKWKEDVAGKVQH